MNEYEQRALAIPEKPRHEGFEFSASQQKAISSLAISYLRSNNIDFNNNTLKEAIGVLGIDCLGRGLSIAGRETLRQTDSVRLFIKKGLEERAEIRKATTQVYKEFSSELMRMEGSYVGYLALPRDEFLKSERELKNFLITPDISSSEKIAYLYHSRREMLPKITKLAISTLPKEDYPQASIDNFPKMQDQAKIVRNMITSIIFRGNPSPVILIDDLSDFSNREDLQDIFLEELPLELSRSIVSRLDLPEGDATDYINGLYTQVKETFVKYAETGHPYMRREEEEAKRDQLYRAFNNNLLLLHPALEEQALITNPTKVQGEDGEYTLWRQDLSTNFGSFKIPTLDGLYRAIRLSEAEGITTERFTEGVSSWANLKRGQERERSRMDGLSLEIQSLDQELDRVKDEKAELPKLTDWIIKTYMPENWRAFVEARRRFKENQQIIDTAYELRSKSFTYIESLKSQNNGEFPQEAPKPDWVLKGQRNYQEQSPARIVASAQRRIVHAVEFLQQDFLTQNNQDFEEEIESIEDHPVNEVKVLIEKTQGEIDRIEIENPRTIFLGENIGASQVIGYIDMLLEDNRIERRRSYSGSKIVEHKNLRNLLRRGQISGYYKGNGVPSEFYLFSLNNRKKALEGLVWAKTRIENVPEAEEVSVSWQKAKIEDWVKKVEVSTLPDDISPSFVEQHIGELNSWMRKFILDKMRIGIRWPKNLLAREVFINWVHRTIDAKRARMEKGPRRSQEKTWNRTRQNLENNITLLSEFITILDNPLFPLKEGEGLESRGFWNLFGKRIQLANAIVNQNLLRDREEKTTETFTFKRRQLYKEYLERRKQRFEKELSDLQDTQPSMSRFIERMRGLNLVLDDSG